MSPPKRKSPSTIWMLIVQIVGASLTTIFTSVVIAVGEPSLNRLCPPATPVPEVQTQTEESRRDSGAQ
jgi:hypothetical protein